VEEVRWDWRIRQVASGVEGVLPTAQRFELKQRLKHSSESFKRDRGCSLSSHLVLALRGGR